MGPFRLLAGGVGADRRALDHFRRVHDDLPALIRSADVVACVPWYEPFGIVPLEAMACGTPVVASAVGGMLDTVEDGVTGLLVPPRDAGAVAAAVCRLVGDPVTLARMGAAAADAVAHRYSWDAVAEATETVYRGVGAAVPEPLVPARTGRKDR